MRTSLIADTEFGIARNLRRLGLRVSSRSGLDLPLLGLLLLLMGCGLAVLYSATAGSDALVIRQLSRFGLGLLGLLVLARVPPVTLRQVTPWLYLLSVGLLVAVAVIGEGRGAARWLDLGVMRFQPSELLKLTLPMMVAWYLHMRSLPPSWSDLLVCALIIAVPAGLVVVQPDLGTALLISSAGAFAVFLAGVTWRRIFLLLALVAASLPVLWQFMYEYQRERVRMVFNPESDPLGDGWNIIQSKIAIGSGGLWGKGWMNGTQSRLDFLPERSTDFILAVIAEEFGLVGVAVLMLLYLLIILRALWIATHARDSYARLLAGSIGLSFFVYVAVNAGMISGLLPVVGVPLPMISYGGTSAVSLLVGFGILMSVQAHRKGMVSGN